MTNVVPFPTPKPPTAAQAVAYIREHGGRIHRYVAGPRVFCLTASQELRDWLLERGARMYVSPSQEGDLPTGSYRRTRDSKAVEYDLDLTAMRVEGNIWEAAG